MSRNDEESERMKPLRLWSATAALAAAILVLAGCAATDSAPTNPEAIIVDHASTNVGAIPANYLDQARATLHIAYGHTSHGSQLMTGMSGLAAWKGAAYAWSNGGSGGALDVRDFYGDFGDLGMANDLGDPSRTAWEQATRTYLAGNPDINVVIWAWCSQVDGSEADISRYLELMDGLER